MIVLAATNRPDVLDSALLRPGRFDRQVTVDRPDVQGRVRILQVHSRGKSLAKDVDLDKVARRTPGFTGADLQNLMNEAAILAARRELKEISKDEISDALERIIAGPEKKGAVVSEDKKKLVAYHGEQSDQTSLCTCPLLLMLIHFNFFRGWTCISGSSDA